MNPASLAIWTIEENYAYVFLALFLCFVAFVYFDKRNKVTAVLEVRGKPAKTLPVLSGRATSFDDDEEDPGAPLPALPADTPHVPYQPPRRSDAELLQRSQEFHRIMAGRRTVRQFSTEPVPREVLTNILSTAGTAPSGAHTEPWTFIAVEDAATKEAIREIVEEEEEENYDRRMSRQWVADLKPFRTQHVKPYLTDAPVLLLVFRQAYSMREDGKKKMHYYSEMSVAIAAGFILAAVQYAGLVALTSTPLNCGPRLRQLLQRPTNERLELLLPVGHPHPAATVPAIARKPYTDITVHV